MAEVVWKGVQPQVIGHYEQLSLNRFLDSGIPSMRKGRDGEKKNKEEEKMVEIVATYVVASRLPNGNRLHRCPLMPIPSHSPNPNHPHKLNVRNII